MPTPLTWPLATSGTAAPTPTNGSFPASAAAAGGDSTDFGTDVSTFPDLDDTFAQLAGPVVVAQHIARSLVDARYGIDLRKWLNDSLELAKVFELQSAIEAQCLGDERVASATVTVAQPDMLSLQVTILLSLLTGQTFAMVLKVSQVSVDLLSVSTGV